MNKVIKTVAFIVSASFMGAAAWAGDTPQQDENLELSCVQHKQADAKDKEGTIYLKCIPSKKKQSSKHEYHDKSINPYD